jgi:hypothetical protein
MTASALDFSPQWSGYLLQPDGALAALVDVGAESICFFATAHRWERQALSVNAEIRYGKGSGSEQIAAGRVTVDRIGDRAALARSAHTQLRTLDSAIDYALMERLVTDFLIGLAEQFNQANQAGQGNPANQQNQANQAFQLTSLADLLAEPEEETPSVVDRTLSRSGVSMVAAKPKVGKTTLAETLAFNVARGEPFFGRQTVQGRVVYLALEEKRAEVANHFRRMGATGEDIHVHVGGAPEEALTAVGTIIAELHPDLLIIDPLFRLVRVRDTNDYAELTRALEPLINLARLSGTHICCVHHMGKGDRVGGDAILGSTAIFGAIDTALILQRRDYGRVLSSVQRYGEDLPETVVAFDPETGIVSAGDDVAEMQLKLACDAVLEAIGDEDLPEAEIREKVGGNRSLTSKAIRRMCDADDGRLVRSGRGGKGNPFTYRKQTSATTPDEDLETTTNQAGAAQAPDLSDSSFETMSKQANQANQEKLEPLEAEQANGWSEDLRPFCAGDCGNRLPPGRTYFCLACQVRRDGQAVEGGYIANVQDLRDEPTDDDEDLDAIPF